MFKKILKLLPCVLILFANNVMAAINLPTTNNTYNLTVQIGNLSYKRNNLPLHDFSYAMTIPDAVRHTGSPLEGLLTPNSNDISTVFYRWDGNDIDINLNISDPAVGNRIIWQGKLIYNKGFNKIVTEPKIVDDLHYIIHINIIQPDQGRPQFIIGIISL